jgi:elongation factor G
MSGKMEKIRNIGIIAHIDAGKTTTTERILYVTGNTHRIGNVDAGDTVTDFMPQERERGITIQSAAITCTWGDCQINIIDTPGHIDFTAEVQRSLRVLDGGVVAFDGVAGVEPQSETVWRQADRFGVPRLGFVNKMDRTGADFWRTLQMVRDRLGANPVALQVPIGSEDMFQGAIDIIEGKSITYDEESQVIAGEIPDNLRGEYERARTELIEALADVNDEVAELYVDEQDIPVELIHRALRQATTERRLIPFLCGSSLKNKGTQPLLDAIVKYLPAPSDVPAIKGSDPDSGEEVTCSSDEGEPAAALVFKINTDPYVGRLSYLRVYSGTVRRGDTLYNPNRGTKERIGRLVRMHADHREEVDEIRAGDIGAVLGLKQISTGETLHAEERPVILEKISFPTPVVKLSIEPKSKADEDKLGIGLHRLAEEDPTFHVTQDEQTGETIIAGMGELHLEVLVDRLMREFRVQANVGQPQVAYCETITKPITAEYRLVRQTGGHGQFAHVVLELEPLESGGGLVFEDRIRGGSIPRTYIPAVRAGVRDAMDHGVLAEYPMVDIKATLVDGTHHEVDSSDYAFRAAAMFAVRENVMKAGPVLLEPVMRVEIVAPEEYTGDMIGELNMRRANVASMELRPGGTQVITADVPLASMFGYATSLRSRTQGRGTFSMEFDHYAQVTGDISKLNIRRVA